MAHFRTPNGIKPKTFPIDLTSQAASKVELTELQKEIRGLGLHCEETELQNLQKSKEDVVSRFSKGAIKSMGIYEEKPKNLFIQKMSTTNTNELQQKISLFQNSFKQVALGSYKPNNTALGYATDLAYIQSPEHYQYLKKNSSDFIWAESGQNTYEGTYATVDAIKNLFIQSAIAMSSTINGNLSKEDTEAFFNNIITPIEDAKLSDYDSGNCSRIIFLVDNFSDGDAEGIGALTLNWRLTIKDYKEKSKNGQEEKHQATLILSARCFTYTNIDTLNNHIDLLKHNFKNSIPPKPTDVIVYEGKPAANKTTFLHGYPLLAEENYIYAIIFYRADLLLIGSMDNTNSKVETTYTSTITSGFSSQITRGFSTELGCEIDAVVSKSNIKVGFNVSISDQWSQSSTESVSYTVPAGEKAYLYQGYMHNDILQMDTKTDTYEYIDSGKFLSNYVMTSQIPL